MREKHPKPCSGRTLEMDKASEGDKRRAGAKLRVPHGSGTVAVMWLGVDCCKLYVSS